VVFQCTATTPYPTHRDSHPEFIENKGQIVDQNYTPNPGVLYLLNIPGMNVQLRRGGFSYDVYTVVKSNVKSQESESDNPMSWVTGHDTNVVNYHRIDFDFLTSNPSCQIITSSPSADYLNYYTTGTPVEGVTGVRKFTSVTYKEIYPGIDLEFVTGPEQLYKYNFIIHPGGDIRDIRLKIEGQSAVSFQEDTITLGSSLGSLDEVIPESYFLYDNNVVGRRSVKTHFRQTEPGIYGFTVDEESPEMATLVIDPSTIRVWGTYYGGIDWDSDGQCAVDPAGNVFLAGSTMSAFNIATAGSFQGSYSGNMDGFLVKFNASGQRQWATYFGGDLHDDLRSCIVSDNGQVYVSGSTCSHFGLATAGAHQTVHGGGLFDCYIEKFDTSGARLWGTYYGGAGSDSPGYLTMGQGGYIFLAGASDSDTGIVTPGTYQTSRSGLRDGFLAKFNSSGVRQWGTYFGGPTDDIAYSCASDSTGNAYIGGYTVSHTGIASPGAHQETFGGWSEGFLAKFTAGGQRLWSTYYGGGFGETALAICTDPSRNVYLAGRTESFTGIATPGSHQPEIGGADDAFLARFDSNGVRQWGTYYGGSGNEFAYSCMTGRSNDIFITGFTTSTSNVSTPGAYQPALAGDADGFLVKFNADGVRQWGTYYGGADGDEFLKCVYQEDDTLYLSGYTGSQAGIATFSSYQYNYMGGSDAMLVKFIECLPVAAAGPITGSATVHRNSSGIPYSIPPLDHAVNYIWTLPAGATIASGAGTNAITVNFSGTATSGNIWVKGTNKCGPSDSAFLYINVLPEFFSVGFIAPDTTCLNHPVTITDTTTSGTTYYWSFCSGSANNDPTGINIGNPGGLLVNPTYLTLVNQNDSCFSFVICQGVGVIRYYHGSSFKNGPLSWINLGTFGGLIGPNAGGIQVKADNGHWYGFVNSNTTMIRLDFRSSPMNIPIATDIGPFPSFSMAQGLKITQEGMNWIGLVTCSTGQKLIRLNFGNTLANNAPVVTDFGSLGGVLTSPAAICIVQENSLWYAMIMAGGNTLARVSFGTSLLNAPSGVNLGNPGGFNSPGGLALLRDCQTTTGYWTNYLVNGELGKLSFPSGIAGTVSGTVLGNTGGLAQPHSFSEIFRQGDTLYSYITNHNNGTLTRLTFLPCTNASAGSSTLYNPPAISYNQTGTYYIHLIVNEGLPVQGTACKPIVVLDPPTVDIGPDDSICPGTSKILDAGAGYSSYLWSTSATTRTITITSPGTYWVNVTKWGCMATDTVHITPAMAPDITVAGNSMPYLGNTEVYTTQPGMTGYTWTFSSGGTLVSGGTPTDNTITIHWDAIGVQWVSVSYTFTNGCPISPFQLDVLVNPPIGFMVPDTTCINHPINIINTTIGGTTFYWTFCSGNTNTDPTGQNIGNPGGLLSIPTYLTLVNDGSDCYSFISCQGPGVIRYYHGNSFVHDPISWTNLGNFGLISFSEEGIQVKKDGSNWYGFVNSQTTLIRLDFGNSLANTPVATDLSITPPFDMAHGLLIVKQGSTWLGFVTCSIGNKIYRLNFGASLGGSYTIEDLGNPGGFISPGPICLVQENSTWYMLISAGGNTLSRLNFGNSLLSTPTGENLGNPGGFNSQIALTILRDCGTTGGYYCNYITNGQLGKLTFPTGVGGMVTGQLLGNIGNLNRPHCFSEIIRSNDTLFSYVTNRGSGSLTRMTFPPCTNSSVPSSILFSPPPFSYNTPGMYNIRLLVDEGLPTEGILCKSLVVMPPPTVTLGNDDTICPGTRKVLDAGPGFSSYLWSNGATTRTITISSPGTYWVDAVKWGCVASDTIHFTLIPAPQVHLGNDTMICTGSQITFDAGACSGCTYQWKNLLTGLVVGAGQTFTTGQAGVYTCSVSTPFGCTGSDTVQLATNITPSVTNDPLYKTICTGNYTNIILTSVPQIASFSWTATGSSSFISGYSPGAGSAIDQPLVNTNVTAETVTYAITPFIGECYGSPVDFVVTVNPGDSVKVLISASSTTTCAGTQVAYTAIPTNGGTSPSYQWQVNGAGLFPDAPIMSYIPANGDVVTCFLTSSNTTCVSNNPATSNAITMTVNPLLPVGVSIFTPDNPICQGLTATFTATPDNGGTTPTYQWQVNGLNVGTNNPVYTFIPAPGDLVSCVLTSSEPCTSSNPASSNPVIMTISPLPVVTFTTCFDTVTTLNAKPIILKGGIPLGGFYSGPGVNLVTGFFTPSIAGVGLKTITYTYTNAALCSANKSRTILVQPIPAFSCGNNLLDIRDGKTYPTVQLGGQCWMAADLDYGTQIPENIHQRDNCISEKYINPASSSQYPASAYQWDELMLYDPTPGRQGLCPPAWHVPAEGDWNTLFANWTNSGFSASPLKYSGYSGFNAILFGARHLTVQWDFQNFAVFYWSSDPHGPYRAWAHGMNDVDPSVSLYPSLRSNAFSVRCLKD